VNAKSGGKPPRRSKPKTASGAPKPRVSKPSGKTKTFSSVESWERKSSGSWTSGQSNKLNPGSEQAVARRRNTPKYVSRTKKVIRPRVRKQQTG
jgi:hypothetical protein